MKIPETSANVGAYYGNEESGQWQGNGVMIDSGVGGGVVGSGDAGFVPPVYPVRPHMPTPGYVVAGAYYPAPTIPGGYPGAPAPPQDDFADYMWMENEEEFDKQVMQQLEEEALMEQCIEAMLEDERERERNNGRPLANGHLHYPTTSNGVNSISLEEQVSKSTLNPLAAEFVPTFARAPPGPTTPPDTNTGPTEDKQPPETTATVEHITTPPTETTTDDTTIDKEELTIQREPMETPEVSAADVQPICRDEKRPKETKRPTKSEPKKPAKTESKPKSKQQPTATNRTDTKGTTKRREDDDKGEDIVVTLTEDLKTKSSVDEIQPETPAIKPINYAAAAKANKPKKPATSPVAEKTTAAIKSQEKIPQKVEKTKTTEKPVQRKNSAK